MQIELYLKMTSCSNIPATLTETTSKPHRPPQVPKLSSQVFLIPAATTASKSRWSLPTRSPPTKSSRPRHWSNMSSWVSQLNLYWLRPKTGEKRSLFVRIVVRFGRMVVGIKRRVRRSRMVRRSSCRWIQLSGWWIGDWMIRGSGVVLFLRRWRISTCFCR